MTRKEPAQPPDPLPVARGARTQPRELRRRQLIESTIDCIAARGLAETRIADVAAGAGMSVGIVNFYFDSKKTLLTETLCYLSDEYRSSWHEARDAAPQDALAQVEALIRMNFTPRICNPRRIAVWFAFFGEARSRPTYQALCQQFDDDYLAQLNVLFGELFNEVHGPRARGSALMLLALWDGMWQNILLNPDVFTPEGAQAVSLEWLHRSISAESTAGSSAGDST